MVALHTHLRRRLDGDVRFDRNPRGYATDASSYRTPSWAWWSPTRSRRRSLFVVSTTYRCWPGVCRHEPNRADDERGGGAGPEPLLTALVSLDVESRGCVVEPKTVLDRLDDWLEEHGLTWRPQPDTHWACTVGGMLGKSFCGAAAQIYGKAAAPWQSSPDSRTARRTR